MPTPRHARLLTRVTTLAASLWILQSCSGGPTKTWTGPVDGNRAFEHVKNIVALGPRPSGSKALTQSAEYIRSEIAKLGLELKEQKFSDEAHAPGIEFHNLWCEIPGNDPKGRVMLVAAHYDTKRTTGHPDPEHNFHFVGAIDGGGASGLLIELARVLHGRKNKPTIWLTWFDGEESLPFDWQESEPTNLFGSRRFAAQMSADKKQASVMVLFDLVGSKNFKCDRDFASHKGLTELFAAAGNAMGASDRMHKYMSRMTDDHIPFRQKGVKVIDLIDYRWRTPEDRRWPGDHDTPAPDLYQRWWHTPEDDLDAMDPMALDFFGNLFMTALPEIEAKYFN